MENRDKLLEVLKRILETQLSWGSSELWTNQDYEKLSIRILDATAANVSATTLKRIWSKVRNDNKPNISTLNTLAKFAGYDDWKNFALRFLAITVEQESSGFELLNATQSKFLKKKILLFAIAGLLLILLAAILLY